MRGAVLVREGNTQLLKYSLDISVSYSTFSPIFKLSKGLYRGGEFSHNYLIDYLIHYLIDYS